MKKYTKKDHLKEVETIEKRLSFLDKYEAVFSKLKPNAYTSQYKIFDRVWNEQYAQKEALKEAGRKYTQRNWTYNDHMSSNLCAQNID